MTQPLTWHGFIFQIVPIVHATSVERHDSESAPLNPTGTPAVEDQKGQTAGSTVVPDNILDASLPWRVPPSQDLKREF
ncbi:hypothetical protein BD311DRAFT_751687 [Dichomitus squalens]|uniref:Uncharacterized protein n=1 Tax=Dichomitus squalens TaxID=114155 RepID=A0A4Q9MZN8_9APHY|nr:hypothetical protein BD311DRAFT_751687 [Dichomitus squalens]